jgi:hypothetical protein
MAELIRLAMMDTPIEQRPKYRKPKQLERTRSRQD